MKPSTYKRTNYLLAFGNLPPGGFVEGCAFGGAVLGTPPSDLELSGSTTKCIMSSGSFLSTANSVLLIGRFRFCCRNATGGLTSGRRLLRSFAWRPAVSDTRGKPRTTTPVYFWHFLAPLMTSSYFGFSGSLPPGGLPELHTFSGASRGAVPIIAALLAVLPSLRRSTSFAMSTS